MGAKARVFSREFKVAAVERVGSGESVAAVAQELGVRRKLLYEWKQRFEAGGVENLRRAGRPRKSAAQRSVEQAGSQAQRIAQLERLVGRQQALIHFFENALRRVERPVGPTAEATGAAGKARSTQPSGRSGSKAQRS